MPFLDYHAGESKAKNDYYLMATKVLKQHRAQKYTLQSGAYFTE